MRSLYIACGLATALVTSAAPSFAQTQTEQGAAQGAADGAKVLGPVGAAAGAVVGATGGLVSDIVAPKFRTYVVAQKYPSYTFTGDVRTGVVLPSTGVTYYDVPEEYHVGPTYRYTIVNDTPVLVDTSTYTVVQTY